MLDHGIVAGNWSVCLDVDHDVAHVVIVRDTWRRQRAGFPKKEIGIEKVNASELDFPGPHERRLATSRCYSRLAQFANT